MLTVPGVRTQSGNIYFNINTAFSNLMSYSRSQPKAESEGIFLLIDREKIVTKTIFNHSNFPYWNFVRVAKSN